ncbi:hypothetical protein Xmau_03796 [Xenorhabdus mauleonii]|uniref:Uncharacterized protein n=1 Tax=Xenorhabdus mauleonii TaxID=351675 RepID=A0A1I3V1E5_9GAMM|nr:hypothetical protein [Xenorhabdus mauleonii]PHM37579.1 hypothetical protein Xmau_03796 [Xenorhabdus mauleonii]SFJ88753.1 hypothetical protein SAMN05421680_1191 [Xenorhabdus mauleonii]
MYHETTVGALIKRLQRYSPDELCVGSLWFDDDFRSQSEGIPMTDDDIAEAMRNVLRCFDANIGINWEAIEEAINLMRQRKSG